MHMLFAARDLPAGHAILYSGDRIAMDHRNGGPYYLQLSQVTAIDAARTSCGEGRWLNDPYACGTALLPNCHFRLWNPPGQLQARNGCMRTTRAVAME
jgi:hypothetical protein